MSLLEEALNAFRILCTTHLYGETSLEHSFLFFLSFSLYGEVGGTWTHLAWGMIKTPYARTYDLLQQPLIDCLMPQNL
jgi:hypothetical protein